MAKRPPREPKLHEPYNAIAEEALPGETIEEWVERMNEEDPHVKNESRHPQYSVLETYDPSMGSN